MPTWQFVTFGHVMAPRACSQLVNWLARARPLVTHHTKCSLALIAMAIAASASPGLAVASQPVACFDITYSSRDEVVRGVLCRPPGITGSRPAVIYLHDDGGASEAQRPNLPAGKKPMPVGLYRDLAEAGFISLGIAYFSQTPAPGPNPDVFAAAPPQTREAALPTWRRIIADGLTFLQNQPDVLQDEIGVVGWSTGGYLAVLTAADASDGYRAVVSLSAPLQLPGGDDLRDRVAALPPTLVLHGDADAVVPVDSATALDAALETAGRHHELAIVPGGTHTWLDEPGREGLRWLIMFLQEHLLGAGAADFPVT